MNQRWHSLWLATSLLLALLFIAAATLTPGAAPAVGSSPAGFLCVACSETAGADAVANVLLFVPLGAVLALCSLSVPRALVVGCLTSCAIEASQHYGLPVGRVASIADVITNSFGTLLGAFVFTSRQSWMHPAPRTAARLALAYAATFTLLFAFSAWALGRDYTVNAHAALSKLPFTPGYGWFHGKILTATYDSTLFSHTGDGPVIVQAAPTDFATASIAVSGVDGRSEFVPLLYVHWTNADEPHVTIGERANDAQLRVQLRGRQLKLGQPELQLTRAFVPIADSVRHLRAEVSSYKWRLSEQHGSVTRSDSLTLTLSTAFTLFQTVVHWWEPLGVIVMMISLPLLFAPLGYFFVRSLPLKHDARGARAAEMRMLAVAVTRDRTLGGTALVVGALALLVAPFAGPIAPTSGSELARAVLGATSGAVLALITLRRANARNATLHRPDNLDTSPALSIR